MCSERRHDLTTKIRKPRKVPGAVMRESRSPSEAQMARFLATPKRQFNVAIPLEIWRRIEEQVIAEDGLKNMLATEVFCRWYGVDPKKYGIPT
jgi:hypothetical protein